MKLAVCLVVRNEERHLAEWIAFHLCAGFDTALVYDHFSDDRTEDVARGASTLLDVRVRNWTERGPGAQMGAYHHAIREAGDEFDWIAVLDADEFLVVHREGGVRALCASMPDEVGAIAVNWAMFGSNGYVRRPRKLVTAAFTRRAPDAFPPNGHVKSIVRPRGVQPGGVPHAFEVTGTVVGPDGAAVRWKSDAVGNPMIGLREGAVDLGIAQVNHYFTRSREHWAQRLQRGNFNAVRSWAEFDGYDRNEVEDRSALARLSDVRELRERIMAAAGAMAPSRERMTA